MTVRGFEGKHPRIAPSAYIDEAAVVIGNVEVGEEASVWPGAVIRGDHGLTRIGARTSIQDNSVIHAGDLDIGEDVTIGHGAIIEARRIGNNVLVGINATILDGAEIGEFCLIAAGAVVKEGARVPPYSFVAGVPAQVRPLQEKWREWLKTTSKLYTDMAKRYKSEKQ